MSGMKFVSAFLLLVALLNTNHVSTVAGEFFGEPTNADLMAQLNTIRQLVEQNCQSPVQSITSLFGADSSSSSESTTSGFDFGQLLSQLTQLNNVLSGFNGDAGSFWSQLPWLNFLNPLASQGGASDGSIISQIPSIATNVVNSASSVGEAVADTSNAAGPILSQIPSIVGEMAGGSGSNSGSGSGVLSQIPSIVGGMTGGSGSDSASGSAVLSQLPSIVGGMTGGSGSDSASGSRVLSQIPSIVGGMTGGSGSDSASGSSVLSQLPSIVSGMTESASNSGSLRLPGGVALPARLLNQN